MTVRKIIVMGLGKVGNLVATLLDQCDNFNVTGVDTVRRSDLDFDIIIGSADDDDFLYNTFKKFDTVVSCLPYHLNYKVVNIAHQLGLNYFDLTEDVPTTNHIIKLSKDSNAVMAPQCGLAPGFIGIVGSSLAKRFSTIRSIELRVGALPQHPSGELGYAFNWSPEGVVNEYLNDCQVIRNGKIQTVPAMQECETIVINGKNLEAFTTSGGLGTMCDSFAGKVDELNYKTMRYPGHMRLMRFYFHELLMKKDRSNAGEILVHAKPPVDDDVVYVHAAVTGSQNNNKEIKREEFVRSYLPREINGQLWRAISWTTASSIASVIELVANGTLPNKGFIRQEDILLDDFLSTKCGAMYNQ